MRSRLRKEIQNLPSTAGNFSDTFLLRDFESPGRVAVSGMFTGAVEVYASADGGRHASSWKIVGGAHTGAGASTMYYDDDAIPPDYELIRVKCTADITNGATPLKVFVTGSLR